jgi:hypothetical protein
VFANVTSYSGAFDLSRTHSGIIRLLAAAFLMAPFELGAQTEPTIRVLPATMNVGGIDSLEVTVIACAYEYGDNMIDLNSILIRTWHFTTASSYVNVTADFEMDNAVSFPLR